MVATDHEQQFKNFIQSMHDQGILDHHFDHVQELQNEENPRFLLEVVTMFCNDAENGIAELTKFLDAPILDFVKLTSFVHQLRGSSSSIGGRRMALACRELRQASDDNNKERCLEALEKVKREYYILRDNLNIISQMQRTILSNEARREQQ